MAGYCLQSSENLLPETVAELHGLQLEMSIINKLVENHLPWIQGIASGQHTDLQQFVDELQNKIQPTDYYLKYLFEQLEEKYNGQDLSYVYGNFYAACRLFLSGDSIEEEIKSNYLLLERLQLLENKTKELRSTMSTSKTLTLDWLSQKIEYINLNVWDLQEMLINFPLMAMKEDVGLLKAPPVSDLSSNCKCYLESMLFLVKEVQRIAAESNVQEVTALYQKTVEVFVSSFLAILNGGLIVEKSLPSVIHLDRVRTDTTLKIRHLLDGFHLEGKQCITPLNIKATCVRNDVEAKAFFEKETNEKCFDVNLRDGTCTSEFNAAEMLRQFKDCGRREGVKDDMRFVIFKAELQSPFLQCCFNQGEKISIWTYSMPFLPIKGGDQATKGEGNMFMIKALAEKRPTGTFFSYPGFITTDKLEWVLNLWSLKVLQAPFPGELNQWFKKGPFERKELGQTCLIKVFDFINNKECGFLWMLRLLKHIEKNVELKELYQKRYIFGRLPKIMAKHILLGNKLPVGTCLIRPSEGQMEKLTISFLKEIDQVQHEVIDSSKIEWELYTRKLTHILNTYFHPVLTADVFSFLSREGEDVTYQTGIYNNDQVQRK